MESQFVVAIASALAGGTISAIAFYFRRRRERSELINVSLFHLLDVWRLLSVTCFFQSEVFSKTLGAALRSRFPAEKVTEKEEATFASWGRKALHLVLGASVDKEKPISHIYEETIINLAPIYPVTAFELKVNVFLVNYMHMAEKIFSEDPMVTEKGLDFSGFKSAMYEEALSQLEGDIRKLALTSSFASWWAARQYIRGVRQRLSGPPDEAVDLVIEHIFVPIIDKHYADIGVPNPNIKSV